MTHGRRCCGILWRGSADARFLHEMFRVCITIAQDFQKINV
ncbi:hypothetical protein HMPREF9163_01881 [Selenomonas sp. oral taxon 138 str. F0429]|nr:hypothetical protein HMPREF9163_01881 [Selenomonas sp. oral taxon 138 str. F0429]